jgi:tRNA dihydrouridine synthase A
MKYYLAPMMGYTDCYLRNLAENLYGDSIQTFSEMIVDKAIIYNDIKTIQKHFLKNNKSAIQIAGSDPQEIQQAIDILNKIELIQHVNFNLGCPSSRVQENMLGLALTQNQDLVKKCLEKIMKYNGSFSVKCRLGLGLDEDKNYINSYLNLFLNLGIKEVFVHCRNGVLNLDTKKNRTIPKINYDLFLECKKNFPKLKLIPNGEINNKETFDFLIHNNVFDFMIGRQFAKDLIFLEKLSLHKIKDKQLSISNFFKDIKDYKFLNLNLIKKSLFTILTNMPNAKNIRNDISKLKDIDTLNEYFVDPSIWN